MKAANSVSKMALAHDIAVDDDFHLEKVDLPTGRLFPKILQNKIFQILKFQNNPLASKKQLKT